MTPQYMLRKSLCRPAHCFDTEQRIRSAQQEMDNLGWAEDYAEPGYTAPRKGVLFADWNVFPSEMDRILERAGYAIEWSDEWATCDGCQKAVRTSPTYYGWQPSYVVQDGEMYCRECTDWEDYLASCEDDATKAAPSRVDPAKFGYVRLSESGAYESGFHPGQTDDPTAILKALQEVGQTGVLFRVSDVGQFDVRFETWIKKGED